jgi:hypothetical protein
MSEDLKKIFANLNNDIEQEKLLEYLNRQLTEEQQHDLEAQMNDDDFMSDALDGLEQLNDKVAVPLIVKELNSGLKKQLDKTKKKKNRRSATPDSWMYYTIILLLLLAITAFVIIKMALVN